MRIIEVVTDKDRLDVIEDMYIQDLTGICIMFPEGDTFTNDYESLVNNLLINYCHYDTVHFVTDNPIMLKVLDMTIINSTKDPETNIQYMLDGVVQETTKPLFKVYHDTFQHLERVEFHNEVLKDIDAKHLTIHAITERDIESDEPCVILYPEEDIQPSGYEDFIYSHMCATIVSPIYTRSYELVNAIKFIFKNKLKIDYTINKIPCTSEEAVLALYSLDKNGE